MCEKILLHELCLALQLQRDLSPPPIKRPPPPTQPPPIPRGGPINGTSRRVGSAKFLQFQYGSLNRRRVPLVPICAPHPLSKSTDGLNTGEETNAPPEGSLPLRSDSCKKTTPSKGPIAPSSPPSGTSSSGTPTPTNAPTGPSFGEALPPPTFPKGTPPMEVFNSPQEGYLLFQSWVAANAACVWDEELVRAVLACRFVGVLVGGYLLIGGTPRVLAAISHAHSRALLSPPPGWNIILLGEIRNCEASVVTKGQFTPLGDALCWVIHRLTLRGIPTDPKKVRSALLGHFPSMTPPDPSLVHATLSDLIRQRKVFHTSRGYGIVQPDTYIPVPAPKRPPVDGEPPAPPRLLSTSEALTKAHGTEEIEIDGRVTHAAVQTDLADLLAGNWSDAAAILAPRDTDSEEKNISGLQRTGSFRSGIGRRGAGVFTFDFDSTGKPEIRRYQGNDLSDISIKGGERGSVLTKILRVSQPRRRLASFSAQFPPPEWQDESSNVKHLHSVATQTRSSKHPGGPESCTWMCNTFWAPRSSTLPRRPPKPFSSSPNATLSESHRPQSASPFSSRPAIPSAFCATTAKQTSSSSSSPSATPTYSSRNASPSLISSSASPSDTLREQNTTSYNREGKYIRNLSPSPHCADSRRDSPSPHHLRMQSIPSSPGKRAQHPNLPKDPRRKPLPLPKAPSDGVPPSKNITEGHYGICKSSPNRYNGAIRGQYSRSESSQLNSQISSENKESENKVIDTKCENNKKNKTDRSLLLLDLSTAHMNNSRKVVSSPTKSEGLRNVFQENLSSIVKGSSCDLASKNICYEDIDKCDKLLYIDSALPEVEEGNVDIEKSMNYTNSKSEENLSKPSKLKLSVAPEKLSRKKSIDTESGKQLSTDEAESTSVTTYPSLSELNLNFSSLTAQKILQGVSVNSIDTLVEVNMIAEKGKQIKDGVTNTNFGFV